MEIALAAAKVSLSQGLRVAVVGGIVVVVVVVVIVVVVVVGSR